MIAHQNSDSKNSDEVQRSPLEMAVMAALVIGIGVWIGERRGEGPRIVLGVMIVFGLSCGLAWRPVLARNRNAWLVLLVFFAGGVLRSDHEWRSVKAPVLGSYQGQGVLRSDPRAHGRSVHAIIEIEGQRFDVWAYGPNRLRLGRYRAGEVIGVDGERRELAPEKARRRQLRHVVGRFDIDSLSTVPNGSLSRASPMILAAHRVRSALGDGARTLSTHESALFAGLVYGDDTAQPPEMIDRFRRSGLAHLTAVSGQNVAYILAIAAPVLSRLRRSTRLILTIVVLGWFAVLTRQEASVIRASTMAGVAAVVFAAGRRASGGQILCAAAGVALLVDPFLAWSVSWWLSMSGAGGLIYLTPAVTRLSARWRGNDADSPGWISRWVSPMCAAQIGVLPVSAAVFGVPSAWSIPCNLLAVPVAGLVMLAGFPLALAAGFMPTWLAGVLMWPLGVGVRWVDSVAALGSRLRPPALVDQVVVGVLIVMVLVAMWYHRRERRVPT